MSPPSPSPSTPYSPSVAVVNKRGQEKMAPPQSKYSPSSPNSSPEVIQKLRQISHFYRVNREKKAALLEKVILEKFLYGIWTKL